MSDEVCYEPPIQVGARTVWPLGPGGWSRPLSTCKCQGCGEIILRTEVCWVITRGRYAGQYCRRLRCLPHITQAG